MTAAQKKLASALMEVGAIRFGAFKLKLHERQPDAPLSPIYIDLRILRSYPAIIDPVTDVYRQLADAIPYDVYADVPTAATPITAILAYKERKPMISPRTDRKKYGLARTIDGHFHAGQRALLIDDLITHAESKLEAISILEESGLIVAGVMVLIDRQQGGFQALRKKGYTCKRAFSLEELLRYYRESGQISSKDCARTLEYLRLS